MQNMYINMARARILRQITEGLEEEGYWPQQVHGCFDVVGRRDNIVLVKALEGSNSLAAENAFQMKHIAGVFGSRPIVVAESAGRKLQDGVVYIRYGVYVLTLETFLACIARELPCFISQRGSVGVRVNSVILREMISNGELTFGEISKIFGVSRVMARRYVKDGAEISLEHAKRVFEFGDFGRNLLQHIEIFSVENIPIVVETEYSKKYLDLGFSASDVHKVAFDIAARKSEEVILTQVGDYVSKDFFSYCKGLRADGLLVFKNKKPAVDIVALQRKKFLQLENADELIEIVKK